MSLSAKIVVVAAVAVMASLGLSRIGSSSEAGAEPDLPFADTPYVLGDPIETPTPIS